MDQETQAEPSRGQFKEGIGVSGRRHDAQGLLLDLELHRALRVMTMGSHPEEARTIDRLGGGVVRGGPSYSVGVG